MMHVCPEDPAVENRLAGKHADTSVGELLHLARSSEDPRLSVVPLSRKGFNGSDSFWVRGHR